MSALGKQLNKLRYGLQLRANRLLGRSFVEPRSFFSFEVAGICNLACRICAYPKKEIGKKVMPTEKFAGLLDEAVALGYRNIGLTPMTGEIFMDKEMKAKFELLERHPAIESYWFYTNFVLADAASIELLASSRKLGPAIYISLYGHDVESFQKVAARPARQFDRLLENLDRLAEVIDRFPCIVDIGFRTAAAFDWTPSPGNSDEPNPLLRRINRLFASGKCRYSGNILEYDSWGGMVTDEDVAGLDMKIVDGSHTRTPRVGACALIFDRPTVFADGRVNACHCHGADGSLVIGHVNDAPLSQILSPANKRFMDLIERHQAGDYPQVCLDCKFYRSIYRKLKRVPTVTTEDYMAMISERN